MNLKYKPSSEPQIFKNSHAGVVVEQGARPTFDGNAIHDGETDGVNIDLSATGCFL